MWSAKRHIFTYARKKKCKKGEKEEAIVIKGRKSSAKFLDCSVVNESQHRSST